MDRIGHLINQVLHEKPVARLSEKEERARIQLLGGLFRLYGESDLPRVKRYLEATLDIPFDKFALAVRVLVRSHSYPNVPQVGEIWTTAREIAGMNREQYDSGRYLPPQRDWPPVGARHGIHFGELEQLPSLATIEAGHTPKLTDGKGVDD